jgi:hypothetical protein
MTDIHSTHSIGGPGGIDPSRTDKSQNAANSKKGTSFSDILDKTSQAEDVGAAKSPTAAGNTASIPPPYIGPVESISTSETVSRMSGEVFQLLDSIQSELKNPAVSLKDLAPMMQNMETQRDRLMSKISSLPPEDPGRNILEEMAVMLTSESAKFQRGDYI